MLCPTCNQELGDSVRFCPNDGTPLVETGTIRTLATPTGPRPGSSRELELPLVIGGRYRLEALRGGGGMAKVYRAIDTQLDREVAIKLINPELRVEPEFDARFQREAKIAVQLHDPHIVVVHDFGIDAIHGPFLVMEYLQGQSLRERLSTEGPMPFRPVMQLAGQIYLALIHAHEKGIVHRDIKPDNIFLLNQSGVRLHVRVLDFGIARIYRSEDGSTPQTITQNGAVLGTPRYMSPEQLAGQQVTERSDLYSAALVIFESLTGQLPYAQGKKLMELCPEATPQLQELLEECLRPAADDRPKSAIEVYLRLQELGKASGIMILPPGSMERLLAARRVDEPTVTYAPASNKPSRRWLLILVALGLLGVAGALSGWWFFGRPFSSSGEENLHGILIGMGRGEVERILNVGKAEGARVTRGNPWKDPGFRDQLGYALKQSDLGVADPSDLVRIVSADGKVCVLLDQDAVVAVVSSHASARSGRGVAIGTEMGRLDRSYREVKQTMDSLELPGGDREYIWRYDSLGIAFEIKAGVVIRMTLFPPRK